MADSEKDFELREDGVDWRRMLEDDRNPDTVILRNVCEIRAQIRNKLRVPILETTVLLCNKIPSMTKEDIMSEEESRLLARARRNLRMGVFDDVSDAYGEALHYHANKENSDDVYNEEYGKYLAGKVMREWNKQGEDRALASLREIKDRPYTSEEIRKSAVDEALFEIKADLLAKMRKRQYGGAVEGMMKLAEGKSLNKGELLDLGMSSAEEEGLLEYLGQFMPILLHINPRIYEAVDAFLKKMGLNAEKWQTSEAMQEMVKNMILTSLKAGMCYLSEMLDELERMGLANIAEVREWPEFNSLIGKKLGDAIKIAPNAYIQLRDYCVLLQLITSEKADNLEEVRMGLNLFLADLTDIHPLVAMYFNNGYLRDIGITTPVDDNIVAGWAMYSSIGEGLDPHMIGEMVDQKVLGHLRQTLAENATKILSDDKNHEVNVFNKVRGAYIQNMSVFLKKYPYFKRYFAEFNVDVGDVEDDE